MDNNDFLKKIKDSIKSEDNQDEILVIKDEDNHHQSEKISNQYDNSLKDQLYFNLENIIEKTVENIIEKKINNLLDSGFLDYKIKSIVENFHENNQYNRYILKNIIKECLKELLD